MVEPNMAISPVSASGELGFAEPASDLPETAVGIVAVLARDTALKVYGDTALIPAHNGRPESSSPCQTRLARTRSCETRITLDADHRRHRAFGIAQFFAT